MAVDDLVRPLWRRRLHREKGTRPAYLFAVVAGAALLVGCGSDSDSPDEAESGETSIVAEAEEEVERMYEGTHEPPPTAAPSPEQGKNVWAISVGNQAIGCRRSR
jgi:hypothetical protein